MLNEYIDECFERNECFNKMMSLINNSNYAEGEKHHIIPRAYFRNKGMKIIDEDNLVVLPRKKHVLIHFYIYKCCKEIIKREMGYSIKVMLKENLLSEEATEEDILKLKSDVMKNFLKKHCKKVVCLDNATVYNSIKETAEITGVNKGDIADICNHKAYSSHGLHFEWATKDSYTLEECKPLIRVYKQRTTKVKCLDTGKIYESISEAVKDTCVPRTKIISCCKGHQKSAYGTHWEYASEPQNIDAAPKQVICLETREVFPSVKECSRRIECDGRTLQRVLGTAKVVNGKHYDYYDSNKSYTDLNIQQLYEKKKVEKKHNNKRKIICLELLKTFNTIEEANDFFKVRKSRISECIRGVRKTAMNMHFEYFQTDIDYTVYAPKRIKELEGRNKPVKCLETGKIYISYREAAKGENASRASINNSINENRQVNGKTWKLATFEEWFYSTFKRVA